MARLILQREPLRKNRPTMGSFFFADNGRTIPLRIDSLELQWRNNERLVSCIPPGTYEMRYSYSPAFERHTWEIIDVPGRDAIRLHAGNYAGGRVSDSKGCILPCMSYGDINADGIADGLSSTLATRQLEAVLAPYDDMGITIEVRNA